MINDIFLGWDKASLLGREDLIVEGLAPHFSGRAKYFTINVGGKIGPDYQKDQLFLELYRNNGKYEIFVHEPRFFTLNVPCHGIQKVDFPKLSVSDIIILQK